FQGRMADTPRRCLRGLKTVSDGQGTIEGAPKTVAKLTMTAWLFGSSVRLTEIGASARSGAAASSVEGSKRSFAGCGEGETASPTTPNPPIHRKRAGSQLVGLCWFIEGSA